MHASETVQITVTFHLINDVILNCFSVADSGFDGQGQPHRWGRQPIIWCQIPRNSLKMKEIEPRRGGSVPGSCFASANGPVSVSMMATKSIVGLCGQATKVTSGDFFS